MMPKALVIGGTGMLKQATWYLADNVYDVFVVARNTPVDEELPPNCTFIKADYTNEADFLRNIKAIGKIDLALVWIHSTAPKMPFKLAELLNNHSCMYYHILGSAAASPNNNSNKRKSQFSSLQNIEYKEVILGFIIEGNHSRWLTNNEISNGVITAIKNNLGNSVVGQIEPWHLKP